MQEDPLALIQSWYSSTEHDLPESSYGSIRQVLNWFRGIKVTTTYAPRDMEAKRLEVFREAVLTKYF